MLPSASRTRFGRRPTLIRLTTFGAATAVAVAVRVGLAVGVALAAPPPPESSPRASVATTPMAAARTRPAATSALGRFDDFRTVVSASG